MTDPVLGKRKRESELSLSFDDFTQVVAAIFDGDGCVRVIKNKILVRFAQSSRVGPPLMLTEIKKRYGGSLCQKGQPLKPSHRPSFQLDISGDKDDAIVNDLLAYSILKRNQVQLAATVTKQNMHEVSLSLSNMKKLHAYQNVPIDEKKITAQYVAGFFMAEGCVSVSEKKKQNGFAVELKFTQKSSQKLLLALNSFFGNIGTVAGQDLRFRNKQDCNKICTIMQPFIFGPKLKQIEIAMKYFNFRKSQAYYLTEAEKTQIREWCAEIKRLKKT